MLPITTIIYTHSHRDHISGATVFAEGRDVEVITPDVFTSDLVGVGSGDRPMKRMGAGYIEPTLRISETTNITREGFELELSKAPGETSYHIIVWLAPQKTLFCGDNFYHAFPNLYAIRGTPYRDFDAWADTMDQPMAFEPDI